MPLNVSCSSPIQHRMNCYTYKNGDSFQGAFPKMTKLRKWSVRASRISFFSWASSRILVSFCHLFLLEVLLKPSCRRGSSLVHRAVGEVVRCCTDTEYTGCWYKSACSLVVGPAFRPLPLEAWPGTPTVPQPSWRPRGPEEVAAVAPCGGQST